MDSRFARPDVFAQPCVAIVSLDHRPLYSAVARRLDDPFHAQLESGEP